MVSLERKPGGKEQNLDLQLLGVMGGVQKGLRVLLESNPQVSKEMILGFLEGRQESFATVVGDFEKKKQALGRTIKGLEEGTIGFEEVILAIGR